jgi:hypothetical protein
MKINAAGILLLVFVLCKVFEYGPIATWSWWWVFSPLWIPFVFIFILGFVGAVAQEFSK